MKKIFFAELIACCLLTLPTSAFASSTLTGKELLDYCEVALDIHDNNLGRVQVENEFLQGTRAGFCEGYLQAIDQAHGKHCLPDHNERLANIAIVVTYLKKHTRQLNMPASSLVLKSYEYYFHC